MRIKLPLGFFSIDTHSVRQYETALTTLVSLHIIGNPTARLGLNPTFKTNFRLAITGGYVHDVTDTFSAVVSFF